MPKNIGFNFYKSGVTLLGVVLSVCLALPAFAQSCQDSCQSGYDKCTAKINNSANTCLTTANQNYNTCWMNAEDQEQQCYQDCYSNCVALGGSPSGCSYACDNNQQCPQQFTGQINSCNNALQNAQNACYAPQQYGLAACYQSLLACQAACS